MEITKKSTKEGTNYLVVTNENNKYYFSQEGDAYSPSTIGATDTEGLTQACEYLESNGYNVVVKGLSPAGFEYESED